MRNKSDPPPKEIYRLWYEYLKESPNFIQACKKALVDEKKMGRKAAAWFWGPGLPGGTPFPEAELGYGVYAFGNIHVLDFEKWWELKKKQLAEIEKRKKVLVEDYAMTVGWDVFGIIEEFKRLAGWEPNLSEFLSHYKTRLESSDGAFLYLKINLRNVQDMEDLKKALGKIVSQKKKKPIIKRNLRWGEKWIYPSHLLYQNEKALQSIERYLEVFKGFKKGLKWRKIADSIPEYKNKRIADTNPGSYEDVVRVCIYDDQKKANRIIENVERGIFPGKYYRTKHPL